MGQTLKAHVVMLPRWFGVPLFGSPLVLGGLLAGGMTAASWVGVATGLLIMAGGHSFNSVLDFTWTGLDRGADEERSAEKAYTSAQNLIAKGAVSIREAALNAVGWYALALAGLLFLAARTGPAVLIVGIGGMSITFFYARSKFNWTHELVLGIGVGPAAVLLGMFATSSAPPWGAGLLASVPFAIITSFGGLALDEWPDAQANLRKGVRSVAYKVWETGVSLEWYLSSWFLFMYAYQIFLVSIGVLHPLSALSFVCWPFFIGSMVFLRSRFKKAAGAVAAAGMGYSVLTVLGHYLGRYL